jgi:hypothetical protein
MKAPGVMVNIIGTPCCNTDFVDILIKLLKFKILLKQVKQGVFVLIFAVCTQTILCLVKWL